MEYTTREQIEPLGHIDPKILEIVAASTVPPDRLTLEGARAGSKLLDVHTLSESGPCPPDMHEYYTSLSIPDDPNNTSIKLKITKPLRPPTRGSPLIVLYYPGGGVIGSHEQLTPYARSFARLFGAVVILPNYRRAPEHKFPVYTTDSWHALKHIATNATSLYGADPSQGFIIGGISQGAHISVILATLARDEALSPPLTGVFASTPYILDKSIVPEKYRNVWFSEEQNENAPELDGPMMRFFIRCMAYDPRSPLYSPFNQPNGFSNLPSFYIQVCGGDPLRDDGLILARELGENGGKEKVKTDVYAGMPHCWWMSYLADHPKTEQLKVDTVKGMSWLLKTTVEEAVGMNIMGLPKFG